MKVQSSWRRETLAIALLLVLFGSAYPRASIAASDPCDFTSAFSFERDQVLECYRSVPFCPDPNDPVSCDRDAQVAHLRATIEGFSDLRETYDATVRWRRNLEAVEKTPFASDYDFFLAMAEVLNEFRNGHWAYYGPACFEETLFALVPLEFGSMIERQRGVDHQIIYLAQPRPYFAAVYSKATGIDVMPHTGKRVVLINGKDPLVFFRDWGRNALKSDSDDGINLMGIFERALYSFRTGSFNPFPESGSVKLVLETRSGSRTSLELPWAFIPFTELGLPGPPSASTAQFHASCFAPAVPSLIRGQVAPSARPVRPEPRAVDERLIEREAWMAALKARRPGPPPWANAVDGFEEVAPSKQNRDISVIVPFSDNSLVVEYTNDSTAIHLFDFSSDWFDELDAGTRYACENSDRLIIDLRSNLGGRIFFGQYLAHYLNPAAPVVPSAVLAFRALAKSQAQNELRDLSERWSVLFPDICYFYEAACYTHVPSGSRVTPQEWSSASTELRGGVRESLSPLVTASFNVPPLANASIACPGKFAGKNLIFLVNGANGSMGFFTPALLKGFGTVVVTGGYLGEPMQMGKTRGGAIVQSRTFQVDADFLGNYFGVEIQNRLPELPRPVEFYLEYGGFYLPDLKKLYADVPTYGDVQIPFWSHSPATDGAAYRVTVSAVERTATIDPVCGSFRELRQCTKYAACAKSALDEATEQGRIGEVAAARALEDAVASCR